MLPSTLVTSQTLGPTDMLQYSACSLAIWELRFQQKPPKETTFPCLPLIPLKSWGANRRGFQPP